MDTIKVHKLTEIDAYIESIYGNRAGDRSEKIRVSASYESANILNSITFDVPIDQANQFFVGQKLRITIDLITLSQ